MFLKDKQKDKVFSDGNSRELFEKIVYSVHLLSDNSSESAHQYINLTTNYISSVILGFNPLNNSSLSAISLKCKTDSLFEENYDKYFKPFLQYMNN